MTIPIPMRTWAKPPLDAIFDEPGDPRTPVSLPRPRALRRFLWFWALAVLTALVGGVSPLITDRAGGRTAVRRGVDETGMDAPEFDRLADASVTVTIVVLLLATAASLWFGFLAWRGRGWAARLVTGLGLAVVAFHLGALGVWLARPEVISGLGVTTSPARDVWAWLTTGFTVIAVGLLHRRRVREHFRDLRFR